MTSKRTAQVNDQEAARELVRELHGLMKDGNALLRKMQDTMSDLEVIAGEVFDERMEAQVEAGLESYKALIGKSIDEAHNSVVRRFDDIYNVLVGNDRENRDIPSIAELVDLYRAAQQFTIGQRVMDVAESKGYSLDEMYLRGVMIEKRNDG